MGVRKFQTKKHSIGIHPPFLLLWLGSEVRQGDGAGAGDLRKKDYRNRNVLQFTFIWSWLSPPWQHCPETGCLSILVRLSHMATAHFSFQTPWLLLAQCFVSCGQQHIPPKHFHLSCRAEPRRAEHPGWRFRWCWSLTPTLGVLRCSRADHSTYMFIVHLCKRQNKVLWFVRHSGTSCNSNRLRHKITIQG